MGSLFATLGWAEGLDASYTKSELQELENNLSQKIKTNISEYLDNGSGFSVSINFRLKKSAPPVATPKAKTASNAPKDMGYLIVPAVQDTPAAAERMPASQNTFDIQSATVMVFVYSQYPDAFIKNIKAVIKGVTDGQSFPSTIKFSYLPSPPPKVTPAEKDKAATPAAAKDAPVPQKGVWDYLRENGMPIAIVLGSLLFGIAMIVGFTVFSNFFKSSAMAVANSIQEFNKSSVKETSSDKSDASPLMAEPVDSTSFDRNLKIIGNVVEKSPHVFISAISERHNDYVGLKKLIPNFVASGETQIQDIFSGKIIAKIEESSEQAKNMSTGEFYSWLDQFVERLTLNHLKKGNRFTRLIDTDIVNNLYGIESEKLTNYAINKNSSLVFKLVMDFLPPDSAKNLFERLTPDQWELVLDERDMNAENINKAATDLYREISEMKHQDTLGINAKEALEEVLVAPISSYLYSKSLSEYDEYFNQIVKASPEIGHKIQEKIWSPSLILRVPEDYLKKKMVSCNLNEREYLLIGFSQEISSRLSECVPEGKMKQVLLDGVAKSQGKYSKEKLAAAETYCKKFLNSLRESCNRGEFAILENNKLSDSSLVHEQEDIKEAA